MLVVYVDPRNTSKLCPVHGIPITYNTYQPRCCSEGGELRRRDAVACWNLMLRARGDESNAPSPRSLLARTLDGSSVPPDPTVTQDSAGMPKSLWAGWKRGPTAQRGARKALFTSFFSKLPC